MSYNQYQKLNRFDTLMFSDPQHLIFAYSPQTRHIRLLQLQKCPSPNKDFAQNEYYSTSLQNINSAYDQQEQPSQWRFLPKRCYLLDSLLATIQKQPHGRPISYHNQYKRLFQAQLQSKIFNWYSETESLLIKHELTQQYYYYAEINNFCFGRKHFVRALNAVQLASDHISRNHCELVVEKAKGKEQMRKFFDLLFGVGLSDGRKGKSQNVGQWTNMEPEVRRPKLSRGNKLMFISVQLWQKIYQYLFLTRDKYYLLDNGSRNGTFFIQCPKNPTILSPQQKPYQFNAYGNKIETNHHLPIRQGFSYEFEGQEYLMKVWRLTSSGTNLANHRQHPQQDPSTQPPTRPLPDPAAQPPFSQHNNKTIRNIQEFQQKINWFNNFEKVSKDYIIDECLLRRSLWKGKKVYEDMLREGVEKARRNKGGGNDSNRRGGSQHWGESNGSSQENERGDGRVEGEEGGGEEQGEVTAGRVHDSYIPFPPLHANQTFTQNQFITKAEFVRLIYHEYLLQKEMAKEQKKKSPQETKQQQKKQKEQEIGQTQTNSITSPSISPSRTKQAISPPQLFTHRHKLNVMVTSLDFNNDFKKLYCIITESDHPRKFHIGSQMVINTARFEFDEHNKCNGYIEFDGKRWGLVAIRRRVGGEGEGQEGGSEGESEDGEGEGDRQEENRQEEDEERLSRGGVESRLTKNMMHQNTSSFHNQTQSKPNPRTPSQINLKPLLSNKIWTKIPSMSHFELNPNKCSKYIIRLAHAFYFQIKFIHFRQ